MNDSENKKTMEALSDEALDKVAGGARPTEAWDIFMQNYCNVCCHKNKDCPHDGPLFRIMKYGYTPCPDKA